MRAFGEAESRVRRSSGISVPHGFVPPNHDAPEPLLPARWMIWVAQGARTADRAPHGRLDGRDVPPANSTELSRASDSRSPPHVGSGYPRSFEFSDALTRLVHELARGRRSLARLLSWTGRRVVHVSAVSDGWLQRHETESAKHGLQH
jgi:hypothetical protein